MITQQANDAISDSAFNIIHKWNWSDEEKFSKLKEYLNSITEHEPEYTLGAEGLREFPSKTYPSSEIAHGYDKEGK